MSMSKVRNLKIVLLGEAGVGKTSLLERFVYGRFLGQTATTIGLDRVARKIIVDGRELVLQLWDTAGSERYHSLNQMLCRGAACVAFVFDVGCYRSFQAVDCWLEEFLASLSSAEPGTFPFVLIGNKSDRTDRKVSMSDALRWCQARSEHGVTYVETSARHDIGVEGAFMAIARAALSRQAADRYSRLSHPDLVQIGEPEPDAGVGQRRGCKC